MPGISKKRSLLSSWEENGSLYPPEYEELETRELLEQSDLKPRLEARTYTLEEVPSTPIARDYCMSLGEIGKKLGVSAEGARLIETKALHKLRMALDPDYAAAHPPPPPKQWLTPKARRLHQNRLARIRRKKKFMEKLIDLDD